MFLVHGSNNLARSTNNVFFNVRRNWLKLGMGMILPALDSKTFFSCLFQVNAIIFPRV